MTGKSKLKYMHAKSHKKDPIKYTEIDHRKQNTMTELKVKTT